MNDTRTAGRWSFSRNQLGQSPFDVRCKAAQFAEIIETDRIVHDYGEGPQANRTRVNRRRASNDDQRAARVRRKAHLRDTQGPETSKTPRNPEGFAMEARGIEPRQPRVSHVANRRIA